MKKNNKLFVTIILLMIGISSYAQFTLTGEIRPRAEFRKGFKTLPDDDITPAFFVSQRTRLNYFYKAEKISAKISFYDVHVWGDEQLKTDIPSIGLNEAWAEIPLCDSLSIRLGKQELTYDNRRLIDSWGWNQMGITHNAALLKYKNSDLQIEFTSAFNQKAENNFGTNYSDMTSTYKTLNILWISKKLTEHFKISTFDIADGYQKENTTNTTYIRGTVGGIAEYKKENKYAAILRAFYQTGRLQSGQQIAAYYWNADFSYFLTEKLNTIIGIDYVSGNDAKDTANKKSNSFNMLYGSGHSFNGNMEYFSSLLKQKKGPGLVDGYIDFIYKWNEKWQTRADFHYFLLQNNYIINTEPIDKKLGAEADLSCKYDFNKEASLMFGFSAMRPEKSMEPIVGGNSSYYGTWAFVMLTVKPTFFKSDKK